MRWLLISVPLLTLCVACPETWRKGGSIDRAMEKDVQDERRDLRRPSRCPMSDEEWAKLCVDSTGKGVSAQCLPECRD